MAEIVQQMLRKTLDALIQKDIVLAGQVIVDDDSVDEMHRRMYALVQSRLSQSPDQVGGLISLLTVSRNLERIADQITNIAEDIIYMVEGRLVRHSGQFNNFSQ